MHRRWWRTDCIARCLSRISCSSSTSSIRDEHEAVGTLQPPVIRFSTRAPLTENDQPVAGAIDQVFGAYIESHAVEMRFTRACEDFATRRDPWRALCIAELCWQQEYWGGRRWADKSFTFLCPR